MNSKIILIVDDEPTNISVVASLLQELYQIRVATNGETALKILENEEPDLILLDIEMPNMNGYEVANKITTEKKTAHIPFIFLTAKNDPQSIVVGFNHGAVDYISKPFAKEELLARVSTHIKLHELQQSLVETLNIVEEKVKELETNKTFLNSILSNSAHAIITTNLKGTITLFNKSAEKLLGYTSEEMIGKQTPALFHKGSQVLQRREEFSKELEKDLESGFETIVAKTIYGLENHDEWIYVSKKGKEFPVSLIITALKDLSGNISGFLGVAEDISDIKAKNRLIDEYMKLIDQNVIASSTDLAGKITYVSNAFSNISGYSKEELIGKKHNIIKHPDMPKTLYEELWSTISKDKVWIGEIKNKNKNGEFYWTKATISPIYNEKKEKVGYTAIREDITDKKYIEAISITDGLTAIYNRRHFNELFPKVINSGKRENKLVNFLILDIDHFKQYNDTYGHQMGDETLIKVAKAIKETLKRSDDYCFRLGGEEFGVLFEIETPKQAVEFANNIRKNIEKVQIVHSGNSASDYVTVSIGLICIKADEINSSDEVYKQADDLLYEAKRSGRNVVFTNIKIPKNMQV